MFPKESLNNSEIPAVQKSSAKINHIKRLILHKKRKSYFFKRGRFKDELFRDSLKRSLETRFCPYHAEGPLSRVKVSFKGCKIAEKKRCAQRPFLSMACLAYLQKQCK